MESAPPETPTTKRASCGTISYCSRIALIFCSIFWMCSGSIFTSQNLLRGKAHKFTLPMQRNGFCLAMTVFGHNTLPAVPVGIFIRGRIAGTGIVIFPVQKQHNIGVLLNGTGVAQIGQNRTVRCALFARTRKLGEGEHRDIELFCHNL